MESTIPRDFISTIIDEKDMTKYYTSASILCEKIVKKCELDAVFADELLELKGDVDFMERFKNISVISQNDDGDEDNDDDDDGEYYDEQDYAEICHLFKKFLFRKEFFNSKYLTEIEKYSPMYKKSELYSRWTDL